MRVSLDGRFLDEEQLGNLSVRQSFGQQSVDLALTGRQPFTEIAAHEHWLTNGTGEVFIARCSDYASEPISLWRCAQQDSQ
jgi:hypothetical protein